MIYISHEKNNVEGTWSSWERRKEISLSPQINFGGEVIIYQYLYHRIENFVIFQKIYTFDTKKCVD